VEGYEMLSLEQTRHTRGEEENKKKNQVEISQFLHFSYQAGKQEILNCCKYSS